MIKPIVNISKIAEDYDTFVLGFDGVLTNGNGILPEAAACVNNLLAAKKKVVVLSNSALRVAQVADMLQKNGIDCAKLGCLMTAGEILHYYLKSRTGVYAALGNIYYHLGSKVDKGMFYGLEYSETQNLENAHFIYMNAVTNPEDTIEAYLPVLEHAASLSIPFVCAGNDTSMMSGGKICLAPGALAEQYAIMGVEIMTLGKPDVRLFRYCLDGLPDLGNILVIGDNIATDIKAACALGYDSALISKGIHVNYLGEGYIPDVAKTRELSNNYDAVPNFVISNLRW